METTTITPSLHATDAELYSRLAYELRRLDAPDRWWVAAGIIDAAFRELEAGGAAE